MFDANKLRAELALRGRTARQVCVRAGMNERTFYNKLDKGSFKLYEIVKIANAAGFDNKTIMKVFF